MSPLMTRQQKMSYCSTKLPEQAPIADIFPEYHW